ETHELSSVGQLCRACATVVLFYSGRWDRAVGVCGDVIADGKASPHARTVATGVAGLVHAMRGKADVARAALLDAQVSARRIALVPMQLLATWGMAIVDESAGEPARALDGYRDVLVRCAQTEERHYCVPVLQFGVAQFATGGTTGDLATATAILADAATTT